MVPEGDDGTFFQFFSLKRNRISPSTSVNVGDSTFELWKDVLITQTAPAEVTAPVIFLNRLSPSEIESVNVKGKAVAILASPEGIEMNMFLADRRYPGLLLNKYSSALLNNGAAAIIFIADEQGEKAGKLCCPQ